MKSKRPSPKRRASWHWATLLTSCLSASALPAAETNAPPPAPKPLTPEQRFEGGTTAYANWIDFAVGGFATSGNKAQFQERHQTPGGPFGGISDFHYTTNVLKDTPLTADGHALFDQDDYRIILGISREDTGYLRISYDQFRTWYNGDGGYFGPSDSYYRLGDNALALDRGEISFEGGLTLEKKPKVTFKYTHSYRDGDKGSTKWGPAHPGGTVTRGIGPSYNDIDERRDSVQVDVTHHIKTSDVGIGARYEHGELDDATKITQNAHEPAVRQRITDRQGTSYDLFNVHSFYETPLRKNLTFSAGVSYTDLISDFSGSRIYGSDFDVSYVPMDTFGFGYYGLDGDSRLHEYVLNLNLLYKPAPHWSVIPSVRIQKEDSDANFSASETLGDNAAARFGGASDRGTLDIRERLDVNYTGFTNWVLYARGEVTEGEGNLKEIGGLRPVGGIGIDPVRRETDDSRLFQKYSLGARWYPIRRVSIDAGTYYKRNAYDYDHSLDNTPNNSANRYPAYLSMQHFDTYDYNWRLTVRPLNNLTLVTRYEFQLSTINTEPVEASGTGDTLASKITSHIVAEDVSWSPWSRLNLAAGFNYVWSETKTPASEVTEAILDAQNNYWTVNFTSSFVVDDRTDLSLTYFYYQADNFKDNSSSGLPLGAEADEHGVKATITRRITNNMRLALNYAYFNYDDTTFGGHRDYDAHMVYSTLRYRF